MTAPPSIDLSGWLTEQLGRSTRAATQCAHDEHPTLGICDRGTRSAASPDAAVAWQGVHTTISRSPMCAHLGEIH